MPAVDLLQDRMVFPPDRIETLQLYKVKKRIKKRALQRTSNEN